MCSPRSSSNQLATTVIVAVGWCIVFAVTITAHAADVTLTVNCDQPGHAISPRLIGIFFEDINFGADGGLNAELVKNGSFEVPVPMLGWSRIGESVSATQEHEAPLKSANPTFLRLRSDEDQPIGGVGNEGYRGMGVKQNELYDFSAQCRSTAGHETMIIVGLTGEDGQELAKRELRIRGSEWQPVEAELSPSHTEAKAHLEINLASRGTVDLDLISLCPRDTWKDRRHGLRKDLVQLLADLKPAFFRFPGGCIVEGSQLKYRYQWKTTIGPRDERRLIVNRWNTEFSHRLTPDYFQSFALGFFEYFQLAEDIGAEPLPIINCGMACQFNSGELVPLDELAPYIQDALDLIEFANGPVTSEWGAKRAALGHPEPFNMRLLGIGNEQWGPEYFPRYERFAQVLQKQHPEIELVSTSGPFPAGERFDYAWPLLRKLNVPIVDEHCYAMPDWFLREATRYDSYDRDGPRVFMGEYAAQSVQIVSTYNRNNLRCALAEAAFLTGIERNSDVVTMSAYAPLMAHEEAWQWRPNLIWFDNLRSCGTPNYYVQQLFSLHRGDVVLPVEVVDHRAARQPGGRIGLGTYDTSVEFRNLRVAHGDQVLLNGKSLTSPAQLTSYGGDWRVKTGVIQQNNQRGSTRAMLGDFNWEDCSISFEAKKIAGREGFAVFFRSSPGGSRIEWNVGGWNNQRHGLIAHLATHSETPQHIVEKEGSIPTGQWIPVRIELQGIRVKCILNGQLIHDADIADPEIARIFASAGFAHQSEETILKVVNPTDIASNVSLTLQGAQVPDSGRLITLTGSPKAENSIQAPTELIPVESTFAIPGTTFEHEFPAHSLSILRVETQ